MWGENPVVGANGLWRRWRTGWPPPPTLVIAQCDTTPTAGRFGREDVTQFSVRQTLASQPDFSQRISSSKARASTTFAPPLSISRGQSDGTGNSSDHAQLLVERRVPVFARTPPTRNCVLGRDCDLTTSRPRRLAGGRYLIGFGHRGLERRRGEPGGPVEQIQGDHTHRPDNR